MNVCVRSIHMIRCLLLMLCSATAMWAATAAEIDITRGGTSLVDGGTDAVAGTAVGSIADLDYSIRNIAPNGSQGLVISQITLSNAVNCTATTPITPADNLPAGTSDLLRVRIIPQATGFWSVALAIANNDGNENPFNITITGSAGSPRPDIYILSPSNAIIPVNGSITVNGTAQGFTTVVTCSVRNGGAAPLYLNLPISLGTALNCFASITAQPAQQVAPGTATPFTVSILPGQGAWSVPVYIASNDPNKAFYGVTLSGSSSGPEISVNRGTTPISQGVTDVPPVVSVATEPSSVTYTISNSGQGSLYIVRYPIDASPGNVRLSGTHFWTEEGQSATVSAQRVNGIRGPISVQWFVDSNTAVAPDDLPLQSGTLNWADGDAADKSFNVVTTDDGLFESTENFRVTLHNPQGGAVLSSPFQGYVSIEDNDGLVPNDPKGYTDFSVASRTYGCSEGGATGTTTYFVEIQRLLATNATLGTASVELISGSATLGTDFRYDTASPLYVGLPSPHYLISLDAVAAGARVQVPIVIVDDNVAESIESLHLRLTERVGLHIGPSTLTPLSERWATVYIADNDTMPSTAIISEEFNCSASLAALPDRVVAPSQSTQLPIQVIPIAAGAWQFRVTIINDDTDEGTFTWLVSGNAKPDLPVAEIQRNGSFIPDGSIDAAPNLVATVSTTLSYNITNTGTADLVLTIPPVTSTPINCVVGTITFTPIAAGPTITLSPGQQTILNVPIQPTTAGAWSFNIALTTNDPVRNPYNFSVTGVATTAPQPEFQWYRSGANQISIATGGTDLRSEVMYQTSTYIFDYQIANIGSATLRVTPVIPAIISSLGCVVNPSAPTLPFNIEANSASAFSFQVTPAAGVDNAPWSFTYRVTTNDSDEATADITVTGTSRIQQPEAAIFRAGSSISNGGANAPGGLIAGSTTAFTYTISNIGSGPTGLTLASDYAVSGSRTDTDADVLSGTVGATYPLTLATGVGNCWYVGLDPAQGPFGGLVANLTTAGLGGELVWEYYSGTSWAPLATTVIMGDANLNVVTPATATYRVAWKIPATWPTLSIASGPAYRWIRARAVTAYATSPVIASVTVSSIGDVLNCVARITSGPASPVAAGTSTDVAISVTPAVAGLFQCGIFFDSNDTDEDPVYWYITGNADQPAPVGPEIQLSRSNTNLSDGSIDNIGSLLAGTAQQVTYTIRNIGSDILELGAAAVTASSNCAVLIQFQPDSVLLPAGGSQVIFEITPTGAGPWQFSWSLVTNDSNENPTDLTVAGNATAPTSPSIVVARGGLTVPDGSIDSVSGSYQGLDTLLVYTVSNAGTSPLVISPAAQTSNFVNCSVVIQQDLPLSIASSGSANLRLLVTPGTVGVWSFNLTIGTNDPNHNPWQAVITGTATQQIASATADLTRGSTGIANGAIDTITAVLPSGVISDPITYTLSNSGSAPLRLIGNGTVGSPIVEVVGTPVNCTVNLGAVPTSIYTVGAGSSVAIPVAVTPSLPSGQSSATWSVVLRIAQQDDAATTAAIEEDNAHNPYVWTLTGAVAGPEINLTRGTGNNIPNNGFDTTVGLTGGNLAALTYQVENNGNAALVLSTPVVVGAPVNCTVNSITAPSTTTVAADATASLTISLTPEVGLSWSVTLSMANNDADEAPYVWTITGSYGPDIALARETLNINNGGTDTYLGSGVGRTSNLVYAVSNAGQSLLTISSVVVTSSANCVATISATPLTLASGASQTFTLSVTPSSAGNWQVVFTITSDDPDENPFVVTVANSTPTTVEARLTRSGITIQQGQVDTIGGTTALASTPLVYTITADGLNTLTVGTPVVSGAVGCTASLVSAPAGSIAPGASSNFQVQVTPTTATTWSFEVDFTSNDPGANPFHYTVSGTSSPFIPSFQGGDSSGCGTGSVAGLMAFAMLLFAFRRRSH